MELIETSFLGSRDRFRDFSAWAAALEFACQEGLRYERWWEGRLPLEEVRRQNAAEQIEKGRKALGWSAEAAADMLHDAD